VKIAAELLEAAPEDLDVDRGVVSVRGVPSRAVHIRDVAGAVYLRPEALPWDVDRALEVAVRYRPDDVYTWSNACHACVCEVDVETGRVTLGRYVVSEDCGTIINPMIVEGQIAGGVAQGIGGALYEHFVYDQDGNPLTTTFVDYGLPSAVEVPSIEYGHIETPSRMPGGFKGMGEGGAIGSPSAVANAVADALSPLTDGVTTFPLGPSQIVTLLQHRNRSQ
jgi:aerobic carbon-monoxide dehydrogenase large subunit